MQLKFEEKEGAAILMPDNFTGNSHADCTMPSHVGNNIQKIAALFAQAENLVGRHQLVIERMTEVIGRPTTSYLLAGVVLLWISGNALASQLGLRSFDPPPFVWLQGVACVSALQIAVIILTTQNRPAKLAQRHAHLDLRRDSLADEMAAAVNVHAVVGELEAIEHRE